MFQLFLYLRRVQDHGILNGKAAARCQDLLVIRGAVLACIRDFSLFHGLLHRGQIPALGLGAGKGHAVQCIQMQKQIHHRGGDQINILHRLAQHSHVSGQAVHLRSIFRHNKEPRIRLRNGQHSIAALIAVRCELLRIVQLVMMGENKTFRISRLSLAAAAGQRQRRSGDQFQKLVASDFHR